jgi:hypothetical protein
MPPKSLVVNSMLTKKPKQQDSYLGYGWLLRGLEKKCPDDQGDQRGFQGVGKKNI